MMYVKSLSSPVKPITVVLFTTFMRSRDLYRFVEPYEPVRETAGGMARQTRRFERV